MPFEPIYRLLTEAQRADVARQPIMAADDALAYSDRVLAEREAEQAGREAPMLLFDGSILVRGARG